MKRIAKIILTVTTVVGIAIAATSCEIPDTEGSSNPQINQPTNEGGGSQPSQPTKSEAQGTISQEQALGAAEDYLDSSHFSREGLIDQLSSKYGDQFTRADAEWAVDHLDVDWNEQAVGAARDYLDISHFSRAGLIDQLSSGYGDQFTKEQATYAADQVGL